MVPRIIFYLLLSADWWCCEKAGKQLIFIKSLRASYSLAGWQPKEETSEPPAKRTARCAPTIEPWPFRRAKFWWSSVVTIVFISRDTCSSAKGKRQCCKKQGQSLEHHRRFRDQLGDETETALSFRGWLLPPRPPTERFLIKFSLSPFHSVSSFLASNS